MANKLDLKIDTSAIRDTIMNFIVPLVCFGLSAVMIFIVIYPSIQKLPQLQADLQNKVTLRTQLESKVVALNKLTDYKSVLEEDLGLVDKILVSDDNVPYLLNQIDQISRGVGLEISKLNYGVGGSTEIDSNTGESATQYIAVNLGASGNYDQLIKFLKNIENAARLIDVSNYRYGVSTTDDTSAVLSLSFLFYSPYLKVNSNATTDEPISLDLTSPDFIKNINFLKSFTFYQNAVPAENVKAEEKPIEEVVNSTEQKQTTSTENNSVFATMATPTPTPTPTPTQ